MSNQPTPAQEIAHHTQGPSSFEKLMLCVGSPNAELGKPNTSNDAADEGTAAHQLAEWVLESPEAEAEDFLGELAYTNPETGKEWHINDEMIEHVQGYCDYVQAIVDQTGGELFIETRLSIERVVPEVYFYHDEFGNAVISTEEDCWEATKSDCNEGFGSLTREMSEDELVTRNSDGELVKVNHLTASFGTSDVIILTDNAIYVIDLKYGRNVKVKAQNEDGAVNPQAMCYAVGAFDLHDIGQIEDINVTIYQPRMDNISTAHVTVDELDEWAAIAADKYISSLDLNAPRTPTKKGCLFCRGKADCKPYAEEQTKELIDDFEGIDSVVDAFKSDKLINPNLLTVEQMAVIHEKSSSINSLLKTIAAELKERALTGVEVPNHYLAYGNQMKYWVDVEKATTAFSRKLSRDQVAPRELLSPAQMAELKDTKGVKLEKSALYAKHMAKKEGAPILVHKDKKRKVYEVSTLEEDFEDVESIEDDFDDIESVEDDDYEF